MDFREFTTHMENVLAYSGSYREASNHFETREIEVPTAHQGQLILFDQFAPHRTVRGGDDGLRVSLDIRFRYDNPYKYEKRIIDRSRFLYYSPGNPGWGYYWTNPKDKRFLNFRDKVSYELCVAKKLGEAERILRQ